MGAVNAYLLDTGGDGLVLIATGLPFTAGLVARAPPIQVLDMDDVAEGVAFMQGLMHWCVDHTPSVEVAVDGGRMTVYRA